MFNRRNKGRISAELEPSADLKNTIHIRPDPDISAGTRILSISITKSGHSELSYHPEFKRHLCKKYLANKM